MVHNEERYMAVVALLAALLIASHAQQENAAGMVQNFSYWFLRIAAQSLLFFVIRSVIEKYFQERLTFTTITVLAILISHLPFVLSVTAVDIVLGYPELGIGASAEVSQSRSRALFLEMIYLADNHIALCLLLSIPRWILRNAAPTSLPGQDQPAGTLLAGLTPPLDGQVIWVEAQEHYVRLTTDNENRLVLARFSDVIREFPNDTGMQVHRSHWISQKAIVAHQKSGQNMSLELTTGDIVPVSRAYQQKLIEFLNR